jgi:AcrR family transcriptional regulator
VGLRELKAEQTRAAVLSAALDAFEARGYDGTTMEEIAEAAGIGIATLYRYFPSKDQILLDRSIRGVGRMAACLEARPAEESVSEALGHALEEYFADADLDDAFVRRLRVQLDRAAVPRARLFDLWHQERTLLEDAIARRAAADPDELWVSVAAHTTLMIMEMALDFSRDERDGVGASEWAHRVVEFFGSDAAVLPRLPRS